MKLIKMPTLIRRIFPSKSWHFSSTENEIYLTFDDGPIPEVTPWVLELLNRNNLKATFFCIGDNVRKHPSVYQQIIDDGHAVGNHTMHHLNGWKTTKEDYLIDIKKSQAYISSKLFRPPYGKLRGSQARKINKEFNIIMWSHLTYDFDATVDMNKVFEKIIATIKPGSIIVFHDSLKAEKQLKVILPKIIDWIKSNDYKSVAIPSDACK